jgi:hypothetical protein
MKIGNYELTDDQFTGKEKIDGYLDLSRLTSIPEGFNPTVGGSLDLSRLTSIPEGFNPTVGGYLYLSRLTSIPEGFNPTVGGYLDLSRLTSKYTKLPENSILTWQGGKFIKVDGIFTEVVSKRGNVYRVKKLNNPKVFYLITDGEKFSHGETLKEAKQDLIFKISNKTKDDYKNLKLTDSLSFEDSIVCYRVITGACSFGTKDFITNRLKSKKKKYLVSQIIELTNNEYGNNNFKNFFK